METSQIRKLDRSAQAIYLHCHICYLLSYLGKITPDKGLQARIEKHRSRHSIHRDANVNDRVGWGTGARLKEYPLGKYTLINLEDF